MIYPAKIKEKLGFDIIEDQLRTRCRSDLGRNRVAQLRFDSNLKQVRLKLTQVHEFRLLLAEGTSPAVGDFSSIENLIKRSQLAGNWLSGTELSSILANVASARVVSDYIAGAESNYSSLADLVLKFDGLAELQLRLERTVDEEGKILDSASPQLRTIRRQMISEEGALRKKVTAVFKQAKSNGYIPEGASIGVRDGRMVIPVIASNKRQIQGFVHDESATGNIVFMEPAGVLDANNKIRELQIAESREIRSILIALTELVGRNAAELTAASDFLGEIDLLWAKAKLAKSLNAEMPEIGENVVLKKLRHPLLVLNTGGFSTEVVPHDIALEDDARILLVSGPNAGGKSVALKSVGLNQLMVQFGILPCCDPDSKIKLFANIFIDIGDEQSIENDLSTYSSHLRNMRIMLEKAGDNSLVLIDEFGSGTDPTFGGAIAEAVLTSLLANNPYGIITTHFSNLKLFADKTDGIVNGAMLFDLDNLKPLYQLESGRPGSSFSLEVAAQSGLPKKVIEYAKSGVGTSQIEIEKLLTRLENEKRKFEEQNKKLASKDHQLNQLKNEYKILKKKLEDRQKEIINLAKEEAALILSQTNKQIEKTIRHIKESKAEKKETKKVRASLAKFAGRVQPREDKPKPIGVEIVGGLLKPGDQAFVRGKNVVVNVLEVKGKKAKVLMGELQSVVNLSSLQKISNREAKRIKTAFKSSSLSQTVTDSMANFSPTLDIRGSRATDVIGLLEKFLDNAVMLNQPNLKVIHGKGNGILRQLVREELKQWPQIEHFGNEHIERGGDGATVIKLR